MALNFSHRPMFSTHLSDENLVSPMRVANGYLLDGISEKKSSDGFGYGGDRFERGGSQESVSSDILDILPSDPFGMDISTTVTAITGWLEDLEVDYGGYGGNEVGTASDGSYNLFAELNMFLNKAMRFQNFPGSTGFGHSWNVENYGLFGSGSESSANNSPSLDSENWDTVDPKGKDLEIDGGDGLNSDGDDGGAPHGALSYALAHLGLRDLLSVEKVCRSLRSAVTGDSLLWRNIHINQPLNEKITDDVLLQLTNRAQGNLRSLSLVECPRITDDGLRRVIETNLKLTKLSVPGSTRLSIEGIMNSLRASKSMGGQGLKRLRVGGLYGMTTKHFEELKELLGSDSQTPQEQSARKPHFYNRGNLYLSCDDDDDRDIDVELCPRCNNLRLVYDCPLEACQGKHHETQLCRACTLCIARCAECGRCFVNNEFEETFCLELLCSVCVNNQMVSAECEPDGEPKSSSCVHG